MYGGMMYDGFVEVKFQFFTLHLNFAEQEYT